MLSWITGAVGQVAGWLGSGIASFFNWLLGGLNIVLTKVIEAADGFWNVLTSLWNVALTLKDSISTLLTTYFPFIPAPVVSVILFGLVAVMIAGIYKKVKG